MSNRKIVDPPNGGSPEYRKELEEILETGECPAPFCKNEAEYHKHPILRLENYWKVTRNTFNSLGTEHRFLIVHREHITEISEVSAGAWIEFHLILSDLVREFSLDGATLVFRFGATERTGASVSHLHAHLVSGIDREAHSHVKPITTTIGFQED